MQRSKARRGQNVTGDANKAQEADDRLMQGRALQPINA
jgi:hypothetical protein